MRAAGVSMRSFPQPFGGRLMPHVQPIATSSSVTGDLPSRLDSAAIARVEARVQTIGRTLLKQAIAARPSIASTEYWKEQAGEWVLADDDLKVRLFRLVDCMPMLDDPAAKEIAPSTV